VTKIYRFKKNYWKKYGGVFECLIQDTNSMKTKKTVIGLNGRSLHGTRLKDTNEIESLIREERLPVIMRKINEN
jgi:hypothetical protein